MLGAGGLSALRLHTYMNGPAGVSACFTKSQQNSLRKVLCRKALFSVFIQTPRALPPATALISDSDCFINPTLYPEFCHFCENYRCWCVSSFALNSHFASFTPWKVIHDDPVLLKVTASPIAPSIRGSAGA